MLNKSGDTIGTNRRVNDVGTNRRVCLRLKDFDYANSNYVYFLTVCARHLSNPFSNETLSKEVVSALLCRREKARLSLYCYCLMPDHFHLVISPKNGWSIPQILQDFKSFTTRTSWKYGITGKLWQRSYYDHIVKREEDLISICRYILDNPVRKGLVENPEDWSYSGMVDHLPMG